MCVFGMRCGISDVISLCSPAENVHSTSGCPHNIQCVTVIVLWGYKLRQVCVMRVTGQRFNAVALFFLTSWRSQRRRMDKLDPREPSGSYREVSGPPDSTLGDGGVTEVSTQAGVSPGVGLCCDEWDT